MQGIEIQLSVLRELQKFLLQLIDDIREKSVGYNRRVMQLREVGVAVQIADYYEANYGVQTFQHLQNLIANITDNDLPYIKAKITQLEQGFIEGDNKMVYQGHSNVPVYRIDGNMIYQGHSNMPVYRMEGNMIYIGHSNTPVYRIE